MKNKKLKISFIFLILFGFALAGLSVIEIFILDSPYVVTPKEAEQIRLDLSDNKLTLLRELDAETSLNVQLTEILVDMPHPEYEFEDIQAFSSSQILRIDIALAEKNIASLPLKELNSWILEYLTQTQLERLEQKYIWVTIKNDSSIQVSSIAFSMSTIDEFFSQRISVEDLYLYTYYKFVNNELVVP